MYKVSKWKDIDQKMNNEYIEFKLCEMQQEIDSLIEYKDLLDEYFHLNSDLDDDDLYLRYKKLQKMESTK